MRPQRLVSWLLLGAAASAAIATLAASHHLPYVRLGFTAVTLLSMVMVVWEPAPGRWLQALALVLALLPADAILLVVPVLDAHHRVEAQRLVLYELKVGLTCYASQHGDRYPAPGQVQKALLLPGAPCAPLAPASQAACRLVLPLGQVLPGLASAAEVAADDGLLYHDPRAPQSPAPGAIARLASPAILYDVDVSRRHFVLYAVEPMPHGLMDLQGPGVLAAVGG